LPGVTIDAKFLAAPTPSLPSPQKLGFYTRPEMAMLLTQAEEYCKKREKTEQDVVWFYRDMLQYQQSEVMSVGILTKKVKDSNGDPNCPINERISGIHFSCNVNWGDGQPYSGKKSPYGNKRLLIPAMELI
jgi:hypothetical protein